MHTRRLVVIAMLTAIVVPAALAAPPNDNASPAPNPAKLCAEQLKTMGAQNFQSTYAPTGNGKNAMGKCISRQAQAAANDQDNAAKKCKAERDKDPAAFAGKYGTNANKKNAFGKCVSQLAKQSADARQSGTLNAAKQCKAERSKDPAAFANKYGTNANKRNAFGKCVSALAKQQGGGKDD